MLRMLALCLVAAAVAAGTAFAGKPSLLRPSSLTAKAPAVYSVTFKTTAGDFVVTVHRAWAPHGADRFYNLAGNGFYDGARFFRVIKGFVVQFGISRDPAVSKAWLNATIPDDPVKQSNTRGFVSYAATGQPNSRTTQVFVNLGNNSPLDGQGFAPFGQVTKGMDVVTRLFSGYGEAPDQGQIELRGEAYLQKSFPRLDRIKSAKLS
jgi:peptidyl-prolyl cis-trans isomerase A (cyclophilin A)